MIAALVRATAIVYADEASHWDRLHARCTRRINHSEAYSHDGACTNMAESFFCRLRRAEIGTHHHISGPYLMRTPMIWRGAKISGGSQMELSSR